LPERKPVQRKFSTRTRRAQMRATQNEHGPQDAVRAKVVSGEGGIL
jgi:hypothetical protein